VNYWQLLKTSGPKGDKMGILSKRGIKIKGVRNPKKYAKSEKLGAKAVKTQLKKKRMLKEAGNIGKPKPKPKKKKK